jgi:exopolyphosphatase/guanosine-5'-triphosphate,3'-diphosphate pyrophosphatase
MEISVLDIGAATLNLLQAQLIDGELVERREFQRFVRLGEGTLLSGVISPDAWNSALTAIEGLLECARPVQPEQLLTVATSVLREAENGPAFRKTLHVLYGLRVRVLSTVEEGTLAFRGAASALEPQPAPLLVLDLGGGCINFALGQGKDSEWPVTSTLSLGTMRLRPAFAPEGVLSRSDAAALMTLVRKSMAMNTLRIRERRAPRLALCSRAARAVREYATRASACPGPIGTLSHGDLVNAQRELLDTGVAELAARGVEEDDADSLAIATTVTRAVFEALNIEEARVVDRGLREGVALEHCRRARAVDGDAQGSTSSL